MICLVRQQKMGHKKRLTYVSLLCSYLVSSSRRKYFKFIKSLSLLELLSSGSAWCCTAPPNVSGGVSFNLAGFLNYHFVSLLLPVAPKVSVPTREVAGDGVFLVLLSCRWSGLCALLRASAVRGGRLDVEDHHTEMITNRKSTRARSCVPGWRVNILVLMISYI